ncbi:MAG: hypothetical protein J5I41_05965, partial [Saprospiraceae bacterium]|nr:hypothetical protein [Saprospiraceae bacterium]
GLSDLRRLEVFLQTSDRFFGLIHLEIQLLQTGLVGVDQALESAMECFAVAMLGFLVEEKF